MTRLHTSAIVTRLRSDELTDCVYWEKRIPDAVTKYLRVRTNSGDFTGQRLTAPHGPRTITFWLTGVGTSPDQAAWVLEQATDALLNFIPTVPGWSCHRISPESSQPVDADPEIDNRFFGVDTWDLYTEPIPS